MKPMVLVTAPVGTRSGYGAHSQQIFIKRLGGHSTR